MLATNLLPVRRKTGTSSSKQYGHTLGLTPLYQGFSLPTHLVLAVVRRETGALFLQAHLPTSEKAASRLELPPRFQRTGTPPGEEFSSQEFFQQSFLIATSIFVADRDQVAVLTDGKSLASLVVSASAKRAGLSHSLSKNGGTARRGGTRGDDGEGEVAVGAHGANITAHWSWSGEVGVGCHTKGLGWLVVGRQSRLGGWGRRPSPFSCRSTMPRIVSSPQWASLQEHTDAPPKMSMDKFSATLRHPPHN